MAHGNTEVEIKVALDKDSFLRLREKLNKIAKFMKISQQSDTYFTPAHRNFMEPRFPFEWLSIRRRDDKAILTYKHYYPENSENATHADEFETVIENPEQLETMFSVLNFRELVTVEKEREVFIYKDEFEIALDTVKDLGRFIEIEALKDFGGVDATRERLLEFARGIGLDISNLEKRGYPYELMKKRGLIKQPK